MLVSSLESRAPDNFTVLGSHFILFQVYFEASNATAIYKLVYEYAIFGPGLRQICNFSSVLLGCCLNFPKSVWQGFPDTLAFETPQP